MDSQFDNALDYHSQGRPGKIEVVPTKPTQTKRDLSLAYSPGVAEPCEEIFKNPQDAYKYTAKGNLVAVISNGTAVLGLGNLGPLASKPVMEGKGVLFKIFADIDVFDIEVDANDPQKFIDVVKALEPTFGGINLEDIKAPESFLIEETLKREMKIPLMHDDQHGTAIISTAGLINALEVAGKKAAEVTVVVSGAGAAGISCVKMWIAIGVQKENIYMFDRDGQVSDDRQDLDQWKDEFKRPKKYANLAEALVNADVFLGLSVGNIMTQDMVRSMAANPIVFALANPNPEIPYEEAIAAREDVIMATGRSDYPNQVNNVLGFPFIFRGALDVRATAINEAMKLAAVKALAALAKEPVPDVVLLAYNQPDMSFGKNYIIPKPLDPRLITTVSPAVAKAAMESGVAQVEITDWEAYKTELRKRMGLDNRFLSNIANRAKQNPQRVVFGEADNPKVLKAAHVAREEGSCIPILLGFEDQIRSTIHELGLNLADCTIIDPSRSPELIDQYGKLYYEKRQRKGLTLHQAVKKMRQRTYFGAMMVELGQADAFISGQNSNYPDTIRPALEIIGKTDGVTKVAGMYIIMSKQGPLFFADTTVNIAPTSDELVDIVKLAYRMVTNLQIKPRIAMLSYSNFGSAKGSTPNNIRAALAKLNRENPEILVDGEMQANTALNSDLRQELFPFSKLGNENANVFIFPDLNSGNIAYKMVQSLGISEAIGPILLGFRKSVHVLQLGSSVREIVNVVNLAVVDAQSKKGLF
jgi:malate dehydrogenase (oxaloacetate-decarboxylating)(NADP+)